MKSKNFDLERKKPKNLKFSLFRFLRFLKNPKKPRFLKTGLDSPGFYAFSGLYDANEFIGGVELRHPLICAHK